MRVESVSAVIRRGTRGVVPPWVIHCDLVSRDGLTCGADGTCNGYACIGSDTTLSLAQNTSCIRASNGLVWCWGNNAEGEMGAGTAVSQVVARPRRIDIFTNVTAIASTASRSSAPPRDRRARPRTSRARASRQFSIVLFSAVIARRLRR